MNNLSVGVRILDCDHREMVEALSQLHATVTADQDRSLTGDLLHKLAHFTQLHFELEEGMMRATKYPRAMVHRRTHQELIRQLYALVVRHTRGGQALNFHSLNFLHAWHADHVQQDDRHYGLWVNQAGGH
jgi:hemerythrin